MPTINHNTSLDTSINRSIFARANTPQEDERNRRRRNGQTSQRRRTSQYRKSKKERHYCLTTSLFCCCSSQLGVDEKLSYHSEAIVRTCLVLAILISTFLMATGVAAGISVFVVMTAESLGLVGAIMATIWMLWTVCSIGVGYLIVACAHTLIRQIVLRMEKRKRRRQATTTKTIEQTQVTEKKQETPYIPPPPEDVPPSPGTPSRPVLYDSSMKRWNMQSLDYMFDFAEKYLETQDSMCSANQHVPTPSTPPVSHIIPNIVTHGSISINLSPLVSSDSIELNPTTRGVQEQSNLSDKEDHQIDVNDPVRELPYQISVGSSSVDCMRLTLRNGSENC